MPDITAFRVATREAKTQSRVKARIEAWWHAHRCPNCLAKAAMLKAFIDSQQPAAATPSAPHSLN